MTLLSGSRGRINGQRDRRKGRRQGGTEGRRGEGGVRGKGNCSLLFPMWNAHPMVDLRLSSVSEGSITKDY